MNTTDTAFYRAFADRVRTTVTPEGSPTVNDTTTTETVEAPAVPATFTGPAAELAAVSDPVGELLDLLYDYDVELVRGELHDGFLGFGSRVNGQAVLVLPASGSSTDNLTIARKEIARMALPRRAVAAPCDNAWCLETESHLACYGDSVEMPPGVLHGFLTHDRRSGTTSVVYGLTDNDEDKTFSKGDQMRAETARVRAHLARLDLLADQLDAINEAGDGVPRPAAGGHFPWCAPGRCTGGTDDEGPWASHDGTVNALPNRGRHQDRTEPLLHSALHDEDEILGGPRLHVTFYDEGTAYTATEADDLIADFEAFLDTLKAQRAQLDEPLVAMRAQVKAAEVSR